MRNRYAWLTQVAISRLIPVIPPLVVRVVVNAFEMLILVYWYSLSRLGDIDIPRLSASPSTVAVRRGEGIKV